MPSRFHRSRVRRFGRDSSALACRQTFQEPDFPRAMSKESAKNDLPTVAALALLAMCVTTSAHEALGHGGTCLALGGQIRLLTSSVFRCSLSSGWIDAGGPISNLVCGLLALIARKLTPSRFSRTRLFLILVTALSWFWEGGYPPRLCLLSHAPTDPCA